MSIVLILFGVAVGGWAVDKFQGDKAVIEDIDRHFAALGRDNIADKTPPDPEQALSVEEMRPTPAALPFRPSKGKRPTKSVDRRPNARKGGSGKTDIDRSSVPNAPQKVDTWPGIEQSAPATYTIDRKLFETAKSNVSPYIQGVRAHLVAKDDKPFGFQLLGIRAQGALFAVGLRNGDVLISVNGFRLDSIDQALLAAAALKSEGRFRVDLVRNGSPLSLYYRVI